MAQQTYEALRSVKKVPIKDALALLGFEDNRRIWGPLEVEAHYWWDGQRRLIGAYAPGYKRRKRRDIVVPTDFSVPNEVSPAELLGFIDHHCKVFFESEGLPLPPEFEIGREYLKRDLQIRCLPKFPTIWANRKFFRFCLTQIDLTRGRSDGDYQIRFQFSGELLKIEARDQRVFCPADGNWIGITEVSARDLFDGLPKRIAGKQVSLVQKRDALIVQGRTIPAKLIELPVGG